MYDGFAEVYRVGASHGIPARELDATLLWQVGAMLRGPKTQEDETLDVFAERIAAAEGRGPEPEARAMPMADVIQLAGRMRGPSG